MPSGSRRRASCARRNAIAVSVKTSSAARVRLRARGGRLEEPRQPEDVAGDGQRPAGGGEADAMGLRQLALLEPLHATQHERHQPVRLGIDAAAARPSARPAGRSIAGRRGVGLPERSRAEGEGLVGHAVLDPEAGQEDDVGEALGDPELRVEPQVGIEEEVVRAHAGEARQPGAVDDQGRRDAVRPAAAGRDQEVLEGLFPPRCRCRH